MLLGEYRLKNKVLDKKNPTYFLAIIVVAGF
jgi:hypothetical protein